MPIKKENRRLYPRNWPSISLAARERAQWKCQHPGCGAQQYAVGHWMLDAKPEPLWLPLDGAAGPAESYSQARQRAADISFQYNGDGPGTVKILVIVLTVAHLDHNPRNCDPANLAAMCQRHHLQYDQQHHNETAYATRMKKRNNLELPL